MNDSVIPISSLSSSSSWVPDGAYWTSQQLDPKAVTWNNISPLCLKTTKSPIRRSCASTKSFQPLVSLRPSIFTFHVLFEESDLKITVFPSCFPLICLEKNFTGIFCKRTNITGHESICSERHKQRDYLLCGSWNREEAAGKSVGFSERRVMDCPLPITSKDPKIVLGLEDSQNVWSFWGALEEDFSILLNPIMQKVKRYFLLLFCLLRSLLTCNREYRD